MCDCIRQLEALFKDTNTEFGISINFGNPDLPAVMLEVATFKKNSSLREKPKKLIATYCPMCGLKYESEK